MKNIITIAILFLGIIANGQKKEFTYNLQGITKVKIDTNTKVKIIAKDSNEMVISEIKNIDDDYFNGFNEDKDDDYFNNKKGKSLEEKTKGLTAIYPGGKDNSDGFGFSIKKEESTLIITDLKTHFQRSSLSIILPKKINITIDTGNLGSLTMQGFTSEVEAKTKTGKINMKDVTGPITAHSNVGDINIEFSKISQISPITISTNVSPIDVTMPTNTKANLLLDTRGTFYTNFDIEIPEKKGLKAVRGSQKIESILNNGGVQIKLKSSLGNIYLRKK